MNTFQYLGATLSENGDLDADMTHRIESGCRNWKRVSVILCDRRISLRVKGKVYKTVLRPIIMYGAETWAVKKAQEKKLDVAEMRMLRWMSGVTKLDRIRNERIRGKTNVGEISNEVQESRLTWYGHVLRREDEYAGNIVMVMEVLRVTRLRVCPVGVRTVAELQCDRRGRVSSVQGALRTGHS